MRVLAADTSTLTGSVALVEGDDVLAQVTLQIRETHEARLMPIIDHLLRQVGWKIDVVEGLAVALGPGSFTGLRIGVATFKALARALEVPLAGVPTLDAYAWAAPYCEHQICPVLDARMGEVYAAFYRFASDGSLERLSDYAALRPEALAERVEAPTLFLGSGLTLYGRRLADLLGRRAVFLPPECALPSAARVAMLAAPRLADLKPDQALALEPLYVRRSIAETSRSELGRGGRPA